MPNKSITFMLSLIKSHLNGDATNLTIEQMMMMLTAEGDAIEDCFA